MIMIDSIFIRVILERCANHLDLNLVSIGGCVTPHPERRGGKPQDRSHERSRNHGGVGDMVREIQHARYRHEA